MELLKYIGKKFEVMKADRTNWDSRFSEISRYVNPAYVNKFTVPSNYTNNEDVRKYESDIVDNTAKVGSKNCTSVLYSMVTPRNQDYQELAPTREELSRDMYVKQFFSSLNKTLMFYRNQSKAGFVSAILDNYLSLVRYGTGIIMVEESATPEVVFSYRSIPLYECYIETDYQSVVNVLFRRFCLKASQIKEQFGEGSLSEKMRREITSGQDTTKFEIIHAVFPRKEAVTGSLVSNKMPFASVYVCLEEKLVLREGGYRTFPYIVSFFTRVPGDTYGTSICEELLPTIREVNRMAKDYTRLLNRIAIPTYLTPSNTAITAANLVPGKMVRGGLSMDGAVLARPMDVPSGQAQHALEAIEMNRKIINEALLVTWFQILQKTPEMTATEYMGRETEKSVLVSPAIGRLQEQLISSLIERELDILSYRRLLPEIPDTLREEGLDYKVSFNAPINKLERSRQADGVLRTVEALSVLTNSTQDPSYMDVFNKDRLQVALSDYYSVDPLLLNTPDEKAAISQGRQAAAEQQQILQAAPSVASMMKVAKE